MGVCFSRNSDQDKGKTISATDSHHDRDVRPDVASESMRDPNDYEYMNILGTGSYGKVIRVRDKKDSSNYAMKIMDKRQIKTIHGAVHLARVKRERKYLRELGNTHPYLVSMHSEINTKNRVYMVLDLCRGGDLTQFMHRHGAFGEETAKILIAELLLAVSYLHSNCLVHRDIRPHNILITDDGHFKLTDLGIAGRIARTPGSPMQYHTTVIGATGYRAPEMINKNSKGYDFSVDYWSIGVVLYELIFNCHPFSEAVKKAKKATKETYEAEDYNPQGISFSGQPCSAEAKDLICKFLELDTAKRFGWRRKLERQDSEADQSKTEQSSKIKDDLDMVPVPVPSQLSSSGEIKGKAGTPASPSAPVPSSSPAPSSLPGSLPESDAASSNQEIKHAPSDDAEDVPQLKLDERIEAALSDELDDFERKCNWPLPCAEIRDHPFFKGVDWINLSERTIPSPMQEMMEKELKAIDPNEPHHYATHIAALEEFNRRDPTVIIAEVFA